MGTWLDDAAAAARRGVHARLCVVRAREQRGRARRLKKKFSCLFPAVHVLLHVTVPFSLADDPQISIDSFLPP